MINVMERKGFAPLILIVIVAALGLAGGIWYYQAHRVVESRLPDDSSLSTLITTSTPVSNPTSTNVNSNSHARTPTNSYAINLPNSLILVDAQGRRTGKDPIT